jgi:hypothetical protein
MDALRRSMERSEGAVAKPPPRQQTGQALVDCARSNRHLTNITLLTACETDTAMHDPG